MANITALVHTKNSAATLESCLKSLDWVDHIVVIDMESQDQSREIAKNYSRNVLTHPDIGYVEPARAFALSKVTTPWTLILDADEEVSPNLAAALLKIAKRDNGNAAEAYYLPRKNIIFEQWISHTGWWPDYQLRFFKTGQVTWPATLHAVPVITGKSEQLPADESLALIHHNYQTIEQYLDRLNRYTTIAAKEKDITTALPLTFSSEFNRRFFAEQGIRDGAHGLALSYLQSMYQVIVQLKQWQAQGFPDRTHPASLVKEIGKMTDEVKYWLADYHIQQTSGLEKLGWQLRRKFRV